jgi:RNA polymerase-binding protein DksA
VKPAAAPEATTPAKATRAAKATAPPPAEPQVPAPAPPEPPAPTAAELRAAAIAAATPPPPPPAPAVVTKPGATVLPGEKPWTKAELAKVRSELEAQVDELRGEITEAEQSWAALQRDSGEGSGDDQADAGTKTFEREHEMSLAANSRDLLSQVERALQRLDDGSYPICESCGNPIGKARLQAFPRATLCVTCKQREERR